MTTCPYRKLAFYVSLCKAADVIFLSDLKSVFIDSEEDTNMAAGKVPNIGKEETTTLDVIVARGDLSWAPDPSTRRGRTSVAPN